MAHTAIHMALAEPLTFWWSSDPASGGHVTLTRRPRDPPRVPQVLPMRLIEPRARLVLPRGKMAPAAIQEGAGLSTSGSVGNT